MKNLSYFFLFICLLFFSGDIFSQQLTYTPINPSFGGSPLNGSWMLGEAQAQNGFTAGGTSGVSNQNDALSNFKASLQSQILSQLSRNLVSSLFGETGLQAGHYEIGDFIIDITPGADGVTILINDLTNGGQTSIVVPYL